MAVRLTLGEGIDDGEGLHVIRLGRADIPPTGRPAVPRQRDDSADGAEGAAVGLRFPDGRVHEAMDFYAGVLGAEGSLAAQVMHGHVEAPAVLVVAPADTPPETVQVIVDDDASVSLSGGSEDAERLRACFAGLAEGGVVRQPLRAAYGGESGIVTDRFGIGWLVTIAGTSS